MLLILPKSIENFFLNSKMTFLPFLPSLSETSCLTVFQTTCLGGSKFKKVLTFVTFSLFLCQLISNVKLSSYFLICFLKVADKFYLDKKGAVSLLAMLIHIKIILNKVIDNILDEIRTFRFKEASYQLAKILVWKNTQDKVRQSPECCFPFIWEVEYR